MFSKPKQPESKRPEKQPETKRRKRRKIKLFGGLMAGAIGGVVATWVVEKYQEGALEVTRRAEQAVDADPVMSRHQEDRLREQERVHGETAHRIARATFGKGLSHTQRRHAAPIVRYAVGALAGGAYGLTAEFIPAVRSGYGTGYAGLLFFGGSQALLPWLNLGPGLQTIPRSKNTAGLSDHLVYGAVLETTRRVLRWLL